MNSKELYTEIKNKITQYKTEIEDLKKTVENLITRILTDIKNVKGNLPTEKEFLDLIAEILDEAIVLPPILEQVDSLVLRQVLYALDKVVLDKLLGPDWYKNLSEKVDKIVNIK